MPQETAAKRLRLRVVRAFERLWTRRQRTGETRYQARSWHGRR